MRLRWSKPKVDGQFSPWDALNAYRVSGLFSRLGAMTSMKADSHEYYRDYTTCSDNEKDMLKDGGDLPLRFRQSSPELPFRPRGDKKTPEHLHPTFIAIVCMMNPIRDPIFVLPVASVIKRIPEVVELICKESDQPIDQESLGRKIDHCISSLNNLGFIQFDKYDKMTFVRLDADYPFPIGRKIDLDKPWLGEMGWDINKFVIGVGEEHAAHRELVRTIHMAIGLASDDARKIMPTAGDVLILDNRRALHCRREYSYRPYKDERSSFVVLDVPKRWVRLFYGFER